MDRHRLKSLDIDFTKLEKEVGALEWDGEDKSEVVHDDSGRGIHHHREGDCKMRGSLFLVSSKKMSSTMQPRYRFKVLYHR
ncbi:hypothetical protein MUK42_11543 [Musa troglodytarum]|uniref:Uncharacterized protein n=1 Tax=Musa troglodytarum TaxID=320322 RepID=A0A9E7IBH3_9LILI|nr:hypothetical protein MUK42_11543 [Musa troglodytarum]